MNERDEHSGRESDPTDRHAGNDSNGDGGSTPSDIVREVFALLEARRWRDVARFVDLEAVQKLVDSATERARATRRAISASDSRKRDPAMPDVVAEYMAEQHARAFKDYNPLEDQFAGVGSEQELEALPVEDALARMLEACDPELRFRALYQREKAQRETSDPQTAAAALFIADTIAESRRRWYRVLGEIVRDSRAWVLYERRKEAPLTEPGLIHHLELRLRDGAWKLLPWGGLFGVGASSTLYAPIATSAAHEALSEFTPSGAVPRQGKWFSRKFETGLSAELFPALLERLRGTPLRLKATLERTTRRTRTWHPPSDVPGDVGVAASPADSGTTSSPGSARPWSIQEHAGHLLDLEDLWNRRIDAFLTGAATLPEADLTNRKTFEAKHDERAVFDILSDFAAARDALVQKFERLGDEDVRHTALHPRLRTPMNVVDFVYFVCEHDDHHLARITELQRLWTDAIRRSTGGPG